MKGKKNRNFSVVKVYFFSNKLFWVFRLLMIFMSLITKKIDTVEFSRKIVTF